MKLSSTAQVLPLLAIFIVASVQQQCAKVFKAAAPKIEQLETGHFSLQVTKPPTRYNWYRVTLRQKFTKKWLDVGLTISYISNYYDPTGIDFSIRAIPKQAYFDAVLTISISTRWLKTHVHYLAASREDITAGIFTINQNLLLEPTGPTQKVFNTFPIIPVTEAWKTNQANIYVYTYISGIKTQDINFNLKINKGAPIFIKGKISMQFSLSNNKKPIQILQITYYLYAQGGKVTSQKFPPTYDFLYNAITDKFSDGYGITGMTAFSAQNTQNLLKRYVDRAKQVAQAQKPQGKGRLLDTLEILDLQKLYLNMQPLQVSIWRKTFEFVDVQFISEVMLSPILRSTLAPNMIKTMAQNKICMNYDNCKQNAGQIALVNGKSSCVICPANKTYNQKTQQCECVEGLIASQDKCIPPADFCGGQSVFIKGNCFQMIKVKQFCDTLKNEMYDEESRKCVCALGFRLTSTLSGKIVCAPICIDGKVLNLETTTCECPQDSFVNDENKCVKCTFFQEWDPLNKVCICKNGATKTKKGQCLLCADNAVLNEEKGVCECMPGFSGNGVFCRELRSLRNTAPAQKPSSSGITVLNSQTKHP